MTVKELIVALQGLNQEAEVRLCFADLSLGNNRSVPVKQVGDIGENVVEIWNDDYLC